MALNLLKIEDSQQKQTETKTVISIASWKRRKVNQHLILSLFDRLGLSQRSGKVAEFYEALSNYGVIAAQKCPKYCFYEHVD